MSERLQVTESKRVKTALLVLVPTLLSLLIGIWVAGYLTVPRIALSSEGDAMVVYDPELGAAAHVSSHTRRIYPAILDRKTFVFDIYTDDRGARVNGPGERSPARTDIVTIGCSFTWGYALPNSDTYASRIAREFKATNANLAMASFGTVQSLQMLRRNRDLASRLVIYGIIAHHMERNVSPCAPSYYPFCLDVSHVAWDERGQPRIAPPYSDGVRRFEQHLTGDFSDPVSWLRHGADVIFGRAYYGWTADIASDEAKKEAALAFLLGEMDKTVTEMGSQLLVVYLPTNYWGPPPSMPGIVDRVKGQAGSKLRFLDLTERFKRNKEAGGPDPYIVGDGHPSAAGHALIADEVARYILREGLL